MKSYLPIILFTSLLCYASVSAQEPVKKKAYNRVEAQEFRSKHKKIDTLQELKRVEYKKRRIDRPDSAHLRYKLHRKSVVVKHDPWQSVHIRKISMSIPCKPNVLVRIFNIMHRLTIVAGDSDKVRLVAVVEHQGESSLTDAEWFSRLHIQMGGDRNAVELRSGYVSPTAGMGTEDTIFNGAMLFDSLGNQLARRSRSESRLILYMPKRANINIQSKYADVSFDDAIDSLEAQISNGRLEMTDVKNLKGTGSYARINAENIKSANLQVINGTLRAKLIGALTISSRNSSITLDEVGILRVLDSQADNFRIAAAGSVAGQKDYGVLELTMLRDGVELDGVNADVKIRKINSSVKRIKLNTKYANLELPVAGLSNYNVKFEGSGGKLAAPFKRKNITGSSFDAIVGNGKPTSFLVKCNNCNVDFN